MNEDCFHLGIKAVIRNKEGKILLLKVNKKTLKDYRGDAYWDIPGGRIHRGSTVEETIRREVFEETGIKSIISIKPLSMVLSNIRIPISKSDIGLILSVYDCKVEAKNKIILSDEHTGYGWFRPKETSKLLEFKYPQEFIQKITQL